ncbi:MULTISPECIES: alpha/beta hydrolase family protein [unclassified Nocardioides]|uniref:alpha/beta hydrolase family protein n=1 Tax=unclassified Nocardioides TaxID=2615069 RepID=UPI0036238926
MLRLLVAAVLAAVAVGSASPTTASAPADPDPGPVVEDLGPDSFAERGPFKVGEVTLALPANDAPVEVWYPAHRVDVAGKRPAHYDLVDWLPSYLQSALPDGAKVTHPSGGVRRVPVAEGRFPLVVFGHGYAGFRTQSSFLTSWLASWGFVVAAPDHRSRDLTAVLGEPDDSTSDVRDLRATITLLRELDGRPSGRFSGHVDTERVGAVGHSAGGAAVEALAVVDRRVATFVAMAGATVGAFGEEKSGPRSRVPHRPGLILAGTADGVAEVDGLVAAYDALRTPKRLVLLEGAGHHAFSDLCEVGAERGGLLAIADLLEFPVPERLQTLATDGCEPPALAPRKAWPAVRQATVAHLRQVLGLDRSRAGLSGLRDAFPGVVSANRSAR